MAYKVCKNHLKICQILSKWSNVFNGGPKWRIFAKSGHMVDTKASSACFAYKLTTHCVLQWVSLQHHAQVFNHFVLRSKLGCFTKEIRTLHTIVNTLVQSQCKAHTQGSFENPSHLIFIIFSCDRTSPIFKACCLCEHCTYLQTKYLLLLLLAFQPVLTPLWRNTCRGTLQAYKLLRQQVSTL